MIDPATAQRVRLLGLDVDGVLTDNAVFLGSLQGEPCEFKRFDVSDGLGIGMMQRSGIPVVWVSGRVSGATTQRAAELKVDELIQDGEARKLPHFSALLERRGIGWDEVAFVGDDLADLPILRRVGLPIAVSNAVDEVKEVADYVTHVPGGRGAVREVIEAILTARGGWDEALRHYLAERGDDVD